MRKQWVINKGQRSQDGGPPSPPAEGGAWLFECKLGTVYLYIRYSKPITWNSSASPPEEGGGRAWLFEYILGTVSLYLGVVVHCPPPPTDHAEYFCKSTVPSNMLLS